MLCTGDDYYYDYFNETIRYSILVLENNEKVIIKTKNQAELNRLTTLLNIEKDD